MAKKKVIGLILGGVIGAAIIGYLIYSNIAPSPHDETPYEPPFGYQKPQIAANDYLKIKNYNESIWTDIFGNDSSPIDLFGLNSDKIYYQCRHSNKALENSSIDVFDMIESLYGITFDVADKDLIKQARDEIGRKWDVWSITRDIWDFSNNSFDTDPDFENVKFPILQNPVKISEVYEEIQALINYSYLKIDNFSASEFIYKMVLKRFPLARPVDSYLEEIITSLNPQNISLLDENVIVFSRKCIKNYSIYAQFHNQSSNLIYISFKNEDNITFYYQNEVELHPEAGIDSYGLVIILGIIGIATIGLIYINYKKRFQIL
ncbi:MAG: hypothetical protein ACFFB0_10360 [Promethearchaeota archaeon]